MRKILIAALVGGSLALPTLVAAHDPTVPIAGPFDNYGQCQRASSQIRNDVRMEYGGPGTRDDINAEGREILYCEEINGEFFLFARDPDAH